MSDPRLNPKDIWHSERNLTKISGRWSITGVLGAVDVVTGNGFGVTRTAAGDYLVTFTDAFSELLTAQVNSAVISGAAVDQFAQVGAFTPGGTGACTLQIRTETGAADTDPADTDSVHFDVTLYGNPLDA